MHRLFESIKYHEGQCHLLPYHFKRMNASCMALYKTEFQCFHSLEKKLENIQEEGLFKLRINYDATSFQLQLNPYVKRNTQHLKLVYADDIDYSLKYIDRGMLMQLKEGYDEIIIVKNGILTDSSFSNLAFWNGKEWHTPMNPLLKGVKRQYLVEQGILLKRIIEVRDVVQYQKVSLINALLDLGELELETIHIIH